MVGAFIFLAHTPDTTKSIHQFSSTSNFGSYTSLEVHGIFPAVSRPCDAITAVWRTPGVVFANLGVKFECPNSEFTPENQWLED